MLRYKVITLLHTWLLTGLPLPVMAFIFHSNRDSTQWDLFMTSAMLQQLRTSRYI